MDAGSIVGLSIGIPALVVVIVAGVCCIRRRRLAAKVQDDATEAMIKQLTEAASKLGLTVERSEGKTKFQADKIVLGIPKIAASGIATFVNYTGGLQELQKKAGEGLQGIKDEILANGTDADIECMNYILNEQAGGSKVKFQNGWMRDCKEDVVRVDEPLTLEGGIVVDKGVVGKVLEVAQGGNTWPGPPSWDGARIDFGGTIGEHRVSRDQFQNLAGVVLPSRQIDDPNAPGGKRGMVFKDFCEQKVAKDCNLTEAQVFALRFYTTWGFVSINNPLRDPKLMEQKESHKLALLVYMLDMAIKQSRAVAAESPDAHVELSLFRGIGKREMDDKFMIEGGTELAPMSTTAQLWVALKYSQGGDSSVLLWLRTQNFMDRGVDLTWVSAFPHEREFLFPPLTYMRAVRNEPIVVQVGGVTYQVIEVKAQM